MEMFDKNNFEERKSLEEVFLEYRHYKLEDVLKKIDNIPDEEESEVVEDDDDFIKVNLKKNNDRINIEEEFEEDNE